MKTILTLAFGFLLLFNVQFSQAQSSESKLTHIPIPYKDISQGYTGDPIVHKDILYLRFNDKLTGAYSLVSYDGEKFSHFTFTTNSKYKTFHSYLGQPTIFNDELYMKFAHGKKYRLAYIHNDRLLKIDNPESYLVLEQILTVHKDKLYLLYTNESGKSYFLYTYDGKKFEEIEYYDDYSKIPYAAFSCGDKLYYRDGSKRLLYIDDSDGRTYYADGIRSADIYSAGGNNLIYFQKTKLSSNSTKMGLKPMMYTTDKREKFIYPLAEGYENAVRPIGQFIFNSSMYLGQSKGEGIDLTIVKYSGATAYPYKRKPNFKYNSIYSGSDAIKYKDKMFLQ